MGSRKQETEKGAGKWVIKALKNALEAPQSTKSPSSSIITITITFSYYITCIRPLPLPPFAHPAREFVFSILAPNSRIPHPISTKLGSVIGH